MMPIERSTDQLSLPARKRPTPALCCDAELVEAEHRRASSLLENLSHTSAERGSGSGGNAPTCGTLRKPAGTSLFSNSPENLTPGYHDTRIVSPRVGN